MTDEVLIANLPPTSYTDAFSNRSVYKSFVCLFKCSRFHNRLHRFRVNKR